MLYIKNLDEIIDNLSEMLFKFDLDLNSYQTDVYLYLDEDGNGRLDEFVNVGGNSWLDDDHITIYTDKEHYNSIFDGYDTIGSLADAIEIPFDELKKRVMEDTGLDEDELEYWDYANFIKGDDDLCSRLFLAYKCELRDNVDYRDCAAEILTSFLKNYYEEEEDDY